jgi:hypothetical protein
MSMPSSRVSTTAALRRRIVSGKNGRVHAAHRVGIRRKTGCRGSSAAMAASDELGLASK